MKSKISKVMAALLIAALLPLSVPLLSFAAESTVYSTDAVRQMLYTEMTERTNVFSITYIGDRADTITKDPLAFFKTVYEGDDDYLEWNRANFSVKYQSLGDVLMLSFNVEYLTSRAQEDHVDMKVDEVLSQIIKPGMNDYEKLYAIHEYICSHVSYDYSLTKYSAYDALAGKKAVCQGYSLLMDRMLEQAGVKTIIIDGDMSGSPHAWNLVRLDEIWYHVDATNDDINNNKYFLKTDGFMADHDYVWNSGEYPAASTTFKKPAKIVVRVDGEEIAFDVPPYVNSDDRTMVPVRFVSESLGASVTWDNASRTVIVESGEDLITMPVNGMTVVVNGTPDRMDTTAVLKNGRTMVPVRFISEYLGADVAWDAENHIVDIYSPGFGFL